MAVIELTDVHRNFRIPHEKHTTLTERMLSLLRPISYERFEALRGINLTVDQGSFVGVIGGNGSGKSTLLKIVSGLLMPDSGTVRVDGSMSALLELGLGFSAELTVRENVELYAAVLGYPRREVTQRVGDAIEFGGLERFRDTKLKNLSTGMRARLGFATALQAESDILLLDEILAVGDAEFQLKCLDVFEDLKQRRKTIVLVSHDLGQVQRFCDEAILLVAGRIEARGDPDSVIAHYMKSVGSEQLAAPVRDDAQRLWGDGRVRLLRGWLESDTGKRIGRVRSGDRATFVVLTEVVEDSEQPVFGVAVKADDDAVVYAMNTQWLGVGTGVLHAGQIVEMRVPFVAALRNGRYSVQVGIADRHTTTFYDLVDRVTHFVVHGSLCRQPGADLQGRLSHADLQGNITCRAISASQAEEMSNGDETAPIQQRGGVR